MGGTYQAIILVLTRAVESLRLGPHLVCVYSPGNDRPAAIANERYFDQWLVPYSLSPAIIRELEYQALPLPNLDYASLGHLTGFP
jgi:hypothetical protein